MMAGRHVHVRMPEALVEPVSATLRALPRLRAWYAAVPPSAWLWAARHFAGTQ